MPEPAQKESDKAAASKPSVIVAWAAIVLGLGAVWGWITVAQRLSDRITFTSVGAATAAFNALIFGPLIVLALVLGVASQVRVLRAGEAPGRWLGVGLAAGAAGLLITVLFSWLNGALVPGEPASTAAELIGLGIGLTAFQVGAEEVLFRGWLQPALTARTGTVAGIVLTALVFGAFHIVGGGAQAPISLVNLALGGLLFGLLAQRSGGLLAPFAAHFAWNAIEDLGLGLVPNPGVGALGSLTNLDLTGAALWGGQSEGLNASIGSALVLLALILPLLSTLRQVQPQVAPTPSPAQA